jgi:hypothetical protein
LIVGEFEDVCPEMLDRHAASEEDFLAFDCRLDLCDRHGGGSASAWQLFLEAGTFYSNGVRCSLAWVSGLRGNEAGVFHLLKPCLRDLDRSTLIGLHRGLGRPMGLPFFVATTAPRVLICNLA